MDIQPLKKSELLFYLSLALCIISAITSLWSFIVYVLARMKEQEQREVRYRNIHYVSLFIFVFCGVILLIAVSNMNP